MSDSERITQLEAQVAEMRKIIGLHPKPQRITKNKKIRMQFRNQILFGGKK